MATRRERVIIEADDRFSAPMARMAAEATALSAALDDVDRNSRGANQGMSNMSRNAERGSQNLNTLNGHLGTTNTHVSNLNSNLNNTSSNLRNLGRNSSNAGQQVQRMGNQFDRASGRAGLLVEGILTLGHAAIPLGAVAVPAVTGLASALGFTAIAAGATVIAFKGVGTALKAAEKARLEPTVANMQAAQVAMGKLVPSARNAVKEIGKLRDEGIKLRDAAAIGFFPGFNEGLRDLQQMPDLLGRLQGILREVGDTAGDIFSNIVDSLGSGRWDDFLAFLQLNARSALLDLATAAGNTAHAVAGIWQATDPLNDDFMGWLVDATADLDKWANSLGQTQGFAEFVDYIRKSGPQVADSLAAVSKAVLDIVEAAAPIGGAVLKGIEAFAKAISAIADSNLGTPIFTAAAAFIALNRAMKITTGLAPGMRAVGTGFTAINTGARAAGGSVRQFGRDVRTMSTAYAGVSRSQSVMTSLMSNTSRAAQRTRTSLSGLGKSAALVGGLALATSGLSDKMGLANTVTLGLMGTMAGPWGAAIGTGIGLVMDFASAQGSSSDSVDSLTATLDAQTGALTANSREWTKKKLLDEGAFEAAEKLGIPLDLVTDSAMGSADALAQVNAAMAEIDKAADNAPDVQTLYGPVDASVNKGYRDTDALRNILGRVRGEMSESASAGKQLAAANHQAASATETLTAALTHLNDVLSGRADLRSYEQAMDDLAKAGKEAAKKVGDVQKLLTKSGEFNVDRQAGRDLQAAWDQAANSALAYSEKIKGVEARSEFLRGARKDIIGMGTAMGFTHDEAVKLANAVLPLSKIKDPRPLRVRVKDEATEKLAKIQRAAQKFGLTKAQATALVRDLASGKIKTAQQIANRFGITKAQATALLKDIASAKIKAAQRLADAFGISKKTATALLNDLASGKINAIQSRLAQLDGQTATVTTTLVTNVVRRHGGSDLYNAAGGLYEGGVKTFANGGLDLANAHRPEIAPAGAYRVWAEPETKGEAYIPLANDWRRPRAKDIAAQTVAMLGGQVQWFDTGGMIRAAAQVGASTPAPRVSVASPSVNVGGAAVRVFIDGNEVRAIVQDENRRDAEYARGMADL